MPCIYFFYTAEDILLLTSFRNVDLYLCPETFVCHVCWCLGVLTVGKKDTVRKRIRWCEEVLWVALGCGVPPALGLMSRLYYFTCQGPDLMCSGPFCHFPRKQNVIQQLVSSLYSWMPVEV